MARAIWIAIDFDHTLWNNEHQVPMEGAQDALDAFHSRGWRVIIHSANKPAFIRQMCEEHCLHVDAIWGENGEIGKPDFAAVFVDDRAIRFTTWAEAVPQVLDMVA